jgi:hypothetical protein
VGSAVDNDVVRKLARWIGSNVGGEECGSVGK